jgi:hypothetical protein
VSRHHAEDTTPTPRRHRPGRQDKPSPRNAWDVYRAAARARWVGRVIAADAHEAIEAAAVEFRTNVKKPIAVQRYEIV